MPNELQPLSHHAAFVKMLVGRGMYPDTAPSIIAKVVERLPLGDGLSADPEGDKFDEPGDGLRIVR